MTRIRVIAVASEMSPLVSTGPLAYAVGGLPAALAQERVETRTLIPGYPDVLAALRVGQTVHSFDDLFGGPAWIHAAQLREIDVYALVAPHLYAREGGPYAGPDGADYPDNAIRFAALAYVGAQIARGLVPGFWPDVMHAHDWQTGLAPAYLHYGGEPRPATVFTVHNIGEQGQFPKELLETLRLLPASFSAGGIEHNGAIGFLRSGLQFSDRITTVSPGHAREIATPEGGAGLDTLLRARADALCGILNGVDENAWNPAKDMRIAARYDHFGVAARAKNKTELQRRLGLRADQDAFLLGVVGRLSWRKGHDLLLEILPGLMERGMQLALLGAGDDALEKGFIAAREAYPGRVAVEIGYGEETAHLIYAGADAFLAPSREEPCGLTQLYALRYGAVPIVARVGGLKDTIIDANEMALQAGAATGVQFFPPTAESFDVAIRDAERLFRDKTVWRQLQSNGMKSDVSWRGPARRYADLYRELAAERAG